MPAAHLAPDPASWTVLGEVELVGTPATGSHLVSRVVPSGPRGLWDALVRATTRPEAPAYVDHEDLVLDPRVNQAHLAFLGAL